MDENEWLTCTVPDRMLNCIQGAASQRKLRLFALACCRRIWPRIRAERVRKAIETVERVADGSADHDELRRAGSTLFGGDHNAARTVVNADAQHAARRTAQEVRRYCGLYAEWDGAAHDVALYAEEIAQSHLLRDVFGSLHFHPVIVEPLWLTWNAGLLASIAQRMYEARDFTDMPILGDAIEEAGCNNTLILNHCRQPGEHVRGCWVLDLLLGKQ